MVKIRTAATAPINLPGTAPEHALTLEEMWQVLEYKTEHPDEFISEIRSSRVVDTTKDEDGNLVGVVRRFKVDAPGWDEEVEEDVTLKKPIMIVFEGRKNRISSYITNVLSVDADSSGHESLYMTSTYDYDHPDLAPGDEQFKKLSEFYDRVGRETVTHTVAVARQMKREGKLPVQGS